MNINENQRPSAKSKVRMGSGLGSGQNNFDIYQSKCTSKSKMKTRFVKFIFGFPNFENEIEKKFRERSEIKNQKSKMKNENWICEFYFKKKQQ